MDDGIDVFGAWSLDSWVWIENHDGSSFSAETVLYFMADREQGKRQEGAREHTFSHLMLHLLKFPPHPNTTTGSKSSTTVCPLRTCQTQTIIEGSIHK